MAICDNCNKYLHPQYRVLFQNAIQTKRIVLSTLYNNKRQLREQFKYGWSEIEQIVIQKYSYEFHAWEDIQTIDVEEF